LAGHLVGTCSVPREDSKLTFCSLRTNIEHFNSAPCFDYNPKWELPEGEVFNEYSDDELLGPSKEDQIFLKILNNNVHVSETGHIELPLPFRCNRPIMPNNQNETFARSKSTLGRLKKDQTKLRSCVEVMQKYIDNNHVEQVPVSETIPTDVNRAWWIPVFHVTHPKKGKVRIVFDSAAKYHGTSLNDHLLPGPDVINRLKSVLIGFRNGYVGFSADIECMFHNFRLPQRDRDYLLFYWFQDNDPNRNITQYRANVHIFGNCYSPAICC